jgi:hypothetical protein
MHRFCECNFSLKVCIAFLFLGTIGVFSVVFISSSRSPATRTLAFKREKNAFEQLKQTGDYDSLGAAFLNARYGFEDQQGVLSVKNPAHRLRGNFDERGLSLQSAAKESQWKIKWQLSSIGYGSLQKPVLPGELTKQNDRVEIVRQDIGLTEWYKNTPGGLEQGFDLKARPANEESLESLRLVLGLEGDLTARADPDGNALTLVNNDGTSVRYEKLKAWDANGTILSARLLTEKRGEVWLEVKDADAVYPIRIDPIFAQTARIEAPDADDNDFFGWSVDIDGDTAVVGAYEEDPDGSAYIFVRTGAGWAFQQKLTSSVSGDGAEFGNSVAISGDTVVIGASDYDLTPNSGGGDHGSAFVFVRSGTTWTEQQHLAPSDLTSGDTFGSGVAIDGETIVVGCIACNIGGISGTAYIFTRSGTTWTQQQEIIGSDTITGDWFGDSVGISGNTIIVSAHADDTGTNTDQGAAYIFVKSGSTWVEQQKLTAGDGATEDFFGGFYGGVSVSGDTAVVGAPGANIGSNAEQGAAYVFVRSGTSWSQQQKITGSAGTANGYFGVSASVSGDRVIVGGDRENGEGAAYLFQRQGTAWNQLQRLSPSEISLADHFGTSVAISGEIAIASAPDYNDDAGAAFIYTLPAAPFDFDGDNKTDISVFRPSTGEWHLRNIATTQFGASTDIITPGDFTGDRKVDIAVWRPSTGDWYILRSEDGTYYTNQFGVSGDIPIGGDFDGDGKADLAVFRPSNSTWYINKSTGGTSSLSFGVSGDLPVAGDYDGDASTDLAIFRPSTGYWWINYSSTNTTTSVPFGVSTDKLVPGDFTGDNRVDVAVWRPSTGVWYILRSEDGTNYSTSFGASGDKPVPGDYDGDGKYDEAVFRPSTGVWYYKASSTGSNYNYTFGQSTDLPVPGAFIP